jgi:Putative Ig domain
MELTVWTQPSGSLGTFQEGSNFNLHLPATSDAGITYKVISGKLPGGLWLNHDFILGTPYEVARDTDFSFCIRASKNNEIADRTFTITISGPDEPVIGTPAGLIDVGPHKQLFMVDNSFINYQLTALDSDTIAGQTLTYFLISGTLPPGLSLTPDGIIYGVVQGVTSLKTGEGNGKYDYALYDAGNYDLANPPSQNNFDVLHYDFAIGYDSDFIPQPRTLNRYYEFIIGVTDGDTTSPPQRAYQIYVVDPNSFRADSESLISNSNVYTADTSYVQAPVWLTPSDLGTYRANNYVTLMLDVFDTSSIYYRLEDINALSIAVATRRSPQNGGSLLYNKIGSYIVTTTDTVVEPQVGHYVKFAGSNTFNRVTNVSQYTTNEYTITLHSPLDVNLIDGAKFCIGTKSQLPPGLGFDGTTGDVFGKVPAQSAITNTYTFTVTAIRLGDIDTNESNSVSKVFTVKIIGEIDSVISWHTSSNLGTLTAGYDSLLSINASTTIPNAVVTYTITDGQLPPGLTLEYDGEITGKVSQFSNTVNFDNNNTTFDINPALYRVTFDTYRPRPNPVVHTDYILTPDLGLNSHNTTFDFGFTKIGKVLNVTTFNQSNIQYGITSFDLSNRSTGLFDIPVGSTTLDNDTTLLDQGLTVFDYPNGSTTFDNGKTTIDRIYKFTVNAADQFYYSAVSKTFNIKVDVINAISYSNLYVKPFMTPSHRTVWSKFIDDSNVFTPEHIYRPYDEAYGVQSELSMLLYAGIETSDLGRYSLLTTDNVKRFQFENVYKAIAYYPGTKTPVYEVIYVKMIDPALANTMYDKHNVTLWRSQISKMGKFRWDYLPLWMRSVQPTARMQLGFILAVPLCFCKVGMADSIITNIKHSNFDFKLLDYTVDRVIVNKIIGDDTDKYIVFNNRNLQ